MDSKLYFFTVRDSQLFQPAYLIVIAVMCQQIRWRLNGRSHGRSYAHSAVRQLCDLPGEVESCNWSGELISTHYVRETATCGLPCFFYKYALLI